MANTAHRTSPRYKGKTSRLVGDNRPKRSPDMIARLIGLGVPTALAADFPLGPHPTGRWCKKIKGLVEGGRLVEEEDGTTVAKGFDSPVSEEFKSLLGQCFPRLPPGKRR